MVRPNWSGRSGVRAALAQLSGAGHDVVDEAVLLGRLGGEPAVAVRVVLDLLERLAGVLGDQLEQQRLQVQRLLGLILMSEAVPPIPPDGWCIMIRACGSE